MSYHLKVKGLAGLHIGQHVTVKTEHTEASGVLQGFKHESKAICDNSFAGESWALSQTHTTITLLPHQNIVATMEDEIVMHGYDAPGPTHGDASGGEIPSVKTTGTAWKVSDAAHYAVCHCGRLGLSRPCPIHYRDPSTAGPLVGKGCYDCDMPLRVCPKHHNAAHQAEMNGETNGPGD